MAFCVLNGSTSPSNWKFPAWTHLSWYWCWLWSNTIGSAEGECHWEHADEKPRHRERSKWLKFIFLRLSSFVLRRNSGSLQTMLHCILSQWKWSPYRTKAGPMGQAAKISWSRQPCCNVGCPANRKRHLGCFGQGAQNDLAKLLHTCAPWIKQLRFINKLSLVTSESFLKHQRLATRAMSLQSPFNCFLHMQFASCIWMSQCMITLGFTWTRQVWDAERKWIT